MEDIILIDINTNQLKKISATYLGKGLYRSAAIPYPMPADLAVYNGPVSPELEPLEEYEPTESVASKRSAQSF